MNPITLKPFYSFDTSDKSKLYSYIYKKSGADVTESEQTDFNTRTQEWSKRTVSNYYGIFYQKEIVGTISLSKQNIEERMNQLIMRYEDFKGHGFATTAFEPVLEFA